MSSMRVALAFSVATVATGAQHPLWAKHWWPCHGRNDTFSVDGPFYIGNGGASDVQVVFHSFSSGDPDCAFGISVGGECAIEVRTGTSCDGPYGQPLFASGLSGNPWQDLRYGDFGIDRTVPVRTGLRLRDLFGKIVLVNDADGEALACSVIEEVEYEGPLALRAELEKYPGYSGALETSGNVWVFGAGSGSQVLVYTIDGADPVCESTDNSAANACGVHIHSGTTCADASLVGGHHYNGDSDPWGAITYVSDASGDSDGVTVKIETGLDHPSETEGRVIVVHDATGARIACGVLEEAEPSSASQVALGWVFALLVAALFHQ